MDRSPFGVVVLDTSDWDSLFAWFDKMQPMAVVVLDRAPLTRELCNRYPDTKVIHRRWWPHGTVGDDNAHLHVEPDAWLNEMQEDLDGDKRPLLYWNNEPNTQPGRLLNATLRVFELAREAGYTVCGPNWGVGWPHDDDVAFFKPLYESAVEHRHFLGLHIYGGRFLWRDYQEPIDVVSDWQIMSSWYTERLVRILGQEPSARFIVTEFGLDKILQIPGSGPYRQLGTTGDDFARQHIGAWDQYLKQWPIYGVTTFSWGDGGGKWHHYNVKDDALFKGTMAAVQVWPDPAWSGGPDPQPPTPDPEPTPPPDPMPDADLDVLRRDVAKLREDFHTLQAKLDAVAAVQKNNLDALRETWNELWRMAQE